MKEFFGLNLLENGKYGFLRTPEGAWSFAHILQVSLFMIAMVVFAIIFGKKNRNKTEKEKNKVLIFTAIIINAFEIVKIITLCIRHQDPFRWIYVLPLFLCSLQLIAIPMAAFSKGRVREASLDFVLTFGILGAVFGTVGATQIYTAHPVLSMDAFFSAMTHSLSGFAALYIAISGMLSLKKENYIITLSILLGFSIIAYVVNVIIDYNYMFLMHHEGTPYSIFYNLVGGSPIFYPIVVVSIFVIYVSLFYFIYLKFIKKKGN